MSATTGESGAGERPVGDPKETSWWLGGGKILATVWRPSSTCHVNVFYPAFLS